MLKPWFIQGITRGTIVLAGAALLSACGGDETGDSNDTVQMGDAGADDDSSADDDDDADDDSTADDDVADDDATDDDAVDDDAADDDVTDDDAADAGADDDLGDAGTVEDECVGQDDTTACGEAGLCIDEVCTPSRCGDGIIDEAAGEQCEDDNQMSGDGCTLCRFDCSEDADCDDGLSCNGAETCSAETHSCELGENLPNQAECTQTNDEMGVCREGDCVPAGCGNGLIDLREECDDGNSVDGDGCESDCTLTCASAKDCDDGNACNGEETCDINTHLCQPGEPLACEANGCTGECSPEAGGCVYPDVDQDGSTCDLDCNDADPATLPGGFECKDGKDNDCDAETTDAEAPGCECYVDADGDGFAVSATGAIAAAGSCPDGYTRVLPSLSTNTDCRGNNGSVFPGQTEYFPTSFCDRAVPCRLGSALNQSFDYNCDGAETPAVLDNKLAADTCAGGGTFCFLKSGWINEIPACGEEGTYRSCSLKDGVCTGVDTPNRVQPCH